MSETTNKNGKRLCSLSIRPIALLGLLVLASPLPVAGDSLSDYGARMCADAGIAPEDCSLTTERRPAARVLEEPDGGAFKGETLAERGRRLCSEQGVPLEDCQALPTGQRGVQEEAVPLSPFLTAPASVPVVDVDPAPVLAAPPVVPSPIPLRERRFVETRPVATPVFRPAAERRFSVERPLPAGAPGPSFRRPPPPGPFLPIERDARFLRPPPPPFDPSLVVEDDTRFFRQPPPPSAFAGRGEPPIVVETGPPRSFARRDAWIVEREWVAEREPGARFFRDRRQPSERFFEEERFFWEVPTRRCFRAVRYSAPPSYRYVTC